MIVSHVNTSLILQVRDDIAKMYLKGDFILAPTFKLYQDLMEFILHAGVVARQDIELPRRPLTAVRRLTHHVLKYAQYATAGFS